MLPVALKICRGQIVFSIAYVVGTSLDFRRKWGYFPYTGRHTFQIKFGYWVAAGNILMVISNIYSLTEHLRT